MMENKFLKNLNQPSRSSAGATSPPLPSASLPRPSGSGTDSNQYDPIRRLTDELSRHSGAIEGLTALILAMNARPQAATQQEVKLLLEEARQGVNYHLKSQQVADLLLPGLTKGMPTPETIKAATDAGIAGITQAGGKLVEGVERAGSGVVSRIERAARSKADELASRIGFTSWQSASLVFVGFLILVGGAMLANQQREAALAQARTETQAVREFTNWVKTQPEGKRLYERYYKP